MFVFVFALESQMLCQSDIGDKKSEVGYFEKLL